MTDNGLTAEEKLCLQRWFRQAIAKLEQEEVTAHLLQTYAEENGDSHREPVARRRLRRTPRFAHQRQALVR
ncbi:MAG TPA: hypothetical protein V6C72_16695 [Chroococcales cyanobacterium]